MLSILIPIFNQDVTGLVHSLANQVDLFPVEIVCLDDGSTIQYKQINRSLKSLPGVNYQELPENIGRSAIRNLLAKRAKHPYLLFLDGDSQIIRSDFLNKYWQDKNEQTVLVGGRTYPDQCPAPSNRLHWTYGVLREQRAKGFQSNNFLIPAEIFHQTGFDESVRTYGHEDTLLGYQLLQKGISIITIDNPVLHDSLQSNENYLDQQISAIQNLMALKERFPALETTLTKTAQRLDTILLSSIILWVLHLFNKTMVANLLGKRPNMRVFDGYKLYIWLTARRAQIKKKRLS